MTRVFGLLLALMAALLAPAPGFAQEEVPFITSPDNVTLEMLTLAGVQGSDHVIDLGSGDGRIVILAARRFGATGLGVEIVPELVERSRRNAVQAGVQDRVSFAQQDLFTTDLTRATVVTMYLLPEVNLQVRPALLALKPGTRVVSHDWDMGDWVADRTTTVPVPDKQVGREKYSRIHLWVVPAKVEGRWCGTGLLRGASLVLSQRFQQFDGTLTHRNRKREISGRIEGGTVRASAGRTGELALEAVDGKLRLVSAPGLLMLARGAEFVQGASDGCY